MRVADEEGPAPSVLVVGGGFAGVGCAKELAKHDIPVTLLDKHNYHQFQPLLYQVATAELSATDVGRSLRAIFKKDPTVDVKQVEVTKVDPDAAVGHDRRRRHVLGRLPGARRRLTAELLRHPGDRGARVPLYTLPDARKLRTRLFEVFEEADSNPERIDEGALNIVIVGAGPTPTRSTTSTSSTRASSRASAR